MVRERGQETFYDLTHIISNLRLRGKNDAERDISVTISPFFREMYVANRLTWIDVAKRFQIRGSIAKAMYRFCQSHRENPVFRGDIRTLALALNMDLRSFAVKGNTPTDSGRHRGTGGKEGVGENQYSDQGEYRDPQPYS
ncbi:hypothetical protein K050079A111_29480 [Bilophila wadsworthia]